MKGTMVARCAISLTCVLAMGTSLVCVPSPTGSENQEHPGQHRGTRRNIGSVSYKTLEEALWAGRYEYLIDYALSHPELDARSHLLVARAAGIQFLRYLKGDLRETATYEQRVEKYNYLAPLCTKHYEAAVLGSPPDQYVRAQLASEWLRPKACSTFASDSALLRRQLPTDPAFESATSPDQIEAQAKRFHTAATQAIENGRQGRLFAGPTRDEIARLLTAEFRIYARIGIPETVFDELLRDLPFLFDEGLPMRFFKSMSDLSQLRGTFRWYLWQAIITPLPEGRERKEMEEQLRRFNEIVQGSLKRLDLSAECRAPFDAEIAKWESMYARLGNNRFVPYFKRALPEYRFSRTCSHLEEGLAEVYRSLGHIGSPAAVPRSKWARDKMVGACKRVAFATLVRILAEYTAYDRPLYNYLPDAYFGEDTGTLNEYSNYTFIPGTGYPFRHWP